MDVVEEEEVKKFARLRSQLCVNEEESMIVSGVGKGFPILHVTKAWEDMCGWSLEECRNKSSNINQGEHTSKETLQVMGKQLSEGKACKVQLVNYRATGEPFWNVLSIFPIEEKGKTVLFVGYLQDYTYRMSKLILVKPRQFFVPGHNFGDKFMGILKDKLAVENSPAQDGRGALDERLQVNARSSLGFAYANYDSEYIMLRILDFVISRSMTVEEDPSRKLAILATKQLASPPGTTSEAKDGEARMALLRFSLQKHGSTNYFVCERIGGDTFMFKELFNDFRTYMKDVIDKEMQGDSYQYSRLSDA
jgi:PAS domain S-box-containing protein